MTIYRTPQYQESVRCYQFYAPYEGSVWILESENGGSIARAYSRHDFEKLITKYGLNLIVCCNPQHWDEDQFDCPLCKVEKGT